MNANRIKRDGFSNPETEGAYQSWPEEKEEKDAEQKKHCGFCSHCFFLPADIMWILCLNADSPYCYETVSVFFTCTGHEPWPEEDSSNTDESQPHPGRS